MVGRSLPLHCLCRFWLTCPDIAVVCGSMAHQRCQSSIYSRMSNQVDSRRAAELSKNSVVNYYVDGNMGWGRIRSREHGNATFILFDIESACWKQLNVMLNSPLMGRQPVIFEPILVIEEQTIPLTLLRALYKSPELVEYRLCAVDKIFFWIFHAYELLKT